VSLLEIAVEAGTFGPVVKLRGESDLVTIGQLRDVLGDQLAGGAQHLTIDLSGLRFADSMTIRLFIETDQALKNAGRTLELLRPQPAVAQSFALLGVDQVLTIRTKSSTGDHPTIC
jgi:anti-anti-sigma factor